MENHRFHGHPKCFPAQDRLNPLTGESMRSCYLRTVTRDEELRKHFTVKVIWECELDDELTQNKEMRDFFLQTKVRLN